MGDILGGGANSTPPSDVPPGGGNPAWDRSSQIWGGIGKGLQGIGSGFSQGTGAVPQFSMPSAPGQAPINTAPVPFQPIMAPRANDVSMDDIIQMLAKLGITL